VPSVAFEATTPAFAPSLPNPARPPQSSEGAQNSPFESLLDDGAQAAPEPPPQSQSQPQSQPAATDTSTNTTQTDSHQTKGQATDGDATPTANTDTKAINGGTAIRTADAGNSIAPDATTTGCKTVNTGKAKADAKICEKTSAGDDAKPAGDGKTTASPTPADPTAVLAVNPVPTTAPAAAVAAAVTVAAPSDATSQTVSAAVLQAAPTVAGHQAIAAAFTPKIKQANLVVQADAGNPADDSKSSTKMALTLQANGKLQPATAEVEKQNASQPHDEGSTNSHHATTADTQPAIAADAPVAASKVAADAGQQQSALTVAPQDAAQNAATPPAPAGPPPLSAQALAVPLTGVAVEIVGRALDGKNHFEIRLDPPELGRIEVRLDVDRDGNTTTRLIADRSDTLNLLRSDSSGLERALQDAGLKTADNSLQFSLRDQSMGRDQNNNPMPGAAQIVVKDDALAAPELNPRNYPRLAGLGGGVDIRV